MNRLDAALAWTPPETQADRDRAQRRRDAAREATQRYRESESNRHKMRARWTAARALRDGRLQRQPCTECGAPKAEMHHAEYARPLVVLWLCRSCHGMEHRA